jgi:hypothetical protein
MNGNRYNYDKRNEKLQLLLDFKNDYGSYNELIKLPYKQN